MLLLVLNNIGIPINRKRQTAGINLIDSFNEELCICFGPEIGKRQKIRFNKKLMDERTNGISGVKMG